jgi:hypothetical protein
MHPSCIKEQYAPYNRMPAFELGFDDYNAGRLRAMDGVAGQAYDRGAEAAIATPAS